MKSADNLNTNNTSIESLLYQTETEKYLAKKNVQHYETETLFVREFFTQVDLKVI